LVWKSTSLRPTRAPAIAVIAWLDLQANRADNFAWCLLGVVAVMLCVQLPLIPHYLRLPFGMSWWTFSFPLASATNETVRVRRAQPSQLGLGISVGFLIAVTIAVAYFSGATISLVLRNAGLPQPSAP
jgi:tellurite resistance protein